MIPGQDDVYKAHEFRDGSKKQKVDFKKAVYHYE